MKRLAIEMKRLAISCLVLSCVLPLSAAVSVDAVTGAITALVLDQQRLFQDVAQGKPAGKAVENVSRRRENLQALLPATTSARRASAFTGTLASGMTSCTVMNEYNMSMLPTAIYLGVSSSYTTATNKAPEGSLKPFP